jgi:hypothetical protein
MPTLLALGLSLALALLSTAIIAAAAGDGSLTGMLRCLWSGHDPHRAHPLGGFRCRRCLRVEADLEGFGL